MKITEPNLEDGTLKDTEATITVGLDEDAAILFFYQGKSVFKQVGFEKYTEYVNAVNDYMMNSDPPYPQFLKNENGKWVPTVPETGDSYGNERYQYRFEWVQLVKGDKLGLLNKERTFVYRVEGKSGKNSIIIDDYPIGLSPDSSYTIWIAAVDPAGNIKEQHFEFRTAKSMPKIETVPVVSGVYGDAAIDLKVTQPGVAKYEGKEIKGTWKVTDTGATLLPMDGSVKCQVTFTPDESYAGGCAHYDCGFQSHSECTISTWR